MAELMIAVVILGIGLLITSSMFPIAWYKAREVAEATIVPTLANTAEVTLKLQCKPSQPQPGRKNADGTENASYVPFYSTSFFPGDWIPNVFSVATERAIIYPDTHVHVMNAGNYLADAGPDGAAAVSIGGELLPVTDNAWRLEDNLDLLLADRNPLQVGFSAPFLEVIKPALGPQFAAHARLSPPIEKRPAEDADPVVKSHWEERFELRRHCWAVLYRFSRLPGLEMSVDTADLNGDGDPNDPADRARKLELADARMQQAQQLNVYYVTLKRPLGARYAQQKGYEPRDSSMSLSEPIDPAAPEAMAPEFDLRLPVAWRFEAELVNLPSATIAGVPAEIIVKRPTSAPPIMLDALDTGFVLIDDRTGQVFRITSRREQGSEVVFALSGDYTRSQVEDTYDYEPNLADNGAIPAALKMRYNWTMANEWRRTGCEVDSALAGCNFLKEKPDDAKLRTYWVFLPPVDRERGPNSAPLFNASQPVVDIEVRELSL